jgi:hypothetical protein
MYWRDLAWRRTAGSYPGSAWSRTAPCAARASQSHRCLPRRAKATRPPWGCRPCYTRSHFVARQRQPSFWERGVSCITYMAIHPSFCSPVLRRTSVQVVTHGARKSMKQSVELEPAYIVLWRRPRHTRYTSPINTIVVGPCLLRRKGNSSRTSLHRESWAEPNQKPHRLGGATGYARHLQTISMGRGRGPPRGKFCSYRH